MILKDAARLVIAGVITGIPLAWSGAHLIASFLFGVAPANALTTLTCCLLVATIATIAALIPARRAARIDPLIALQQE
jgi:ABC-type antimicrobial peptide transport system permease subunit